MTGEQQTEREGAGAWELARGRCSGEEASDMGEGQRGETLRDKKG